MPRHTRRSARSAKRAMNECYSTVCYWDIVGDTWKPRVKGSGSGGGLACEPLLTDRKRAQELGKKVI